MLGTDWIRRQPLERWFEKLLMATRAVEAQFHRLKTIREFVSSTSAATPAQCEAGVAAFCESPAESGEGL
jgi:hypothetical protein